MEALAFASRGLSPVERNYTSIERKLLSTVFAMKEFRTYLLGKSGD